MRKVLKYPLLHLTDMPVPSHRLSPASAGCKCGLIRVVSDLAAFFSSFLPKLSSLPPVEPEGAERA